MAKSIKQSGDVMCVDIGPREGRERGGKCVSENDNECCIYVLSILLDSAGAIKEKSICEYLLLCLSAIVWQFYSSRDFFLFLFNNKAEEY